MRILLTFLALFSSSGIFSQPTFNYYYTHSLTESSYVNSKLIALPEGGVIGSDMADTNAFILFKIDINGNMLWKRQFLFDSLQFPVIPYTMALLEDSTVGVLVQFFPEPEFVIIKCDLSGNILWANKYNGLSSFHFGDLAPDTDGGMVFAEGDILVYINSDGSIKKTLNFASQFNLMGIANKGEGQFTALAKLIFNEKFILFDIDSSGVISNNYQYTIAGDSAWGLMYFPSEHLVISPSGGKFCMVALWGFAAYGFGVFYFDEQNHPVWAKKIQENFFRYIVATNDSGCIVNCDGGNSDPLFTKFDIAGNLEWSKSILDPFNQTSSIGINSLVPDAGSGWYVVPPKENLHVYHTDSAFSSFCFSQNAQPSILNLQIQYSIQPVSHVPITLTGSAINVMSTSLDWYRYDACTGILIDSTTGMGELHQINFSLYPNPVTEILNIKFSKEINEASIKVFNMLGEKISDTEFRNQSELAINLNQLLPGIYFVSVQGAGLNHVEKILKL